jgi:hypothetical protein
MRSSSLLTTNPIVIVWGRFLCLLGLHRWHYGGKLRLNRLAGVGEVGRCHRDCLAWRPTIREGR